MFSTACILSCLSPLTLNWSQPSLSLALLEVSYCFPSLCCQVLDHRGSSDCCVFFSVLWQDLHITIWSIPKETVVAIWCFCIDIILDGCSKPEFVLYCHKIHHFYEAFQVKLFFKDEQLWNRILCFLELHPCFSFSFWNRLTPPSLKGKHSELLKINTPVIPLTLVQQLWGNVGRSKSL